MKTPIKFRITTPLLLLACFALLPSVLATPDPPAPGGANTADGANALQNRTTGEFNTAFGTNALFSLTTGSNNGAQGNSALFTLTTGNGNSAVGSIALRFLTIGNHNVAIGNTALNNLTTGSRNTAVGYGTNRSGNNSDNTTVGWSAMISNTTGNGNVAVGAQALQSSTVPGVNTFGGNVAVGFQALSNTVGSASTGDSNTAIGDRAMLDNINGFNNTAVGIRALENSTASGNIAIGAFAGSAFTTAGGSVAIGVSGANESSRTFVDNLTNSQIQSFNGGTIKYVTSQVSNGRLGVTAVVSSRRYKHDIKPMGNVSEAILALKPTTFRLNKEVDTNGFLGFGLIAEDVEEVNPDLVYHDEQGRPESVRYDEVWACLLNEFLKEHKKVEEQQASIADLKSTVALQRKGMEVLTAQLKEQAAQIQRVSAQVEMNKPAPSTVANK